MAVLPLLRELPAPLAAILLQQANRYEVMFPHERREVESTLARLRAPRSEAAQQAVESFRALRVPVEVRLASGEAEPSGDAEAFTAVMWSSGQIAAFRQAAQLMVPPEPEERADVPRCVVVVFDAALRSTGEAPELFRRLRPAGTLYPRVSGADAPQQLEAWMEKRLQASPQAYAHWLISGGHSSGWPTPRPVVRMTYDDLRPARLHLLQLMNHARSEGAGGGPEGLRSAMMAMRGRDMGMGGDDDPVLQAFAADVLVAGSGTQLYSTTFVQWSVREALRRARPQTVLAHFAPRNAAASMDVRLSNPKAEPPADPAGSLVDAEMHTYMTYINLLRLPAALKASMLVWHAGYGQALLIGAHVPAGSTNAEEHSLSRLLAWTA